MRLNNIHIEYDHCSRYTILFEDYDRDVVDKLAAMARANIVKHGLVSEGLASDLVLAAQIKAKALAAMPHKISNIPVVKELIQSAKDSNVSLVDNEWWWSQLDSNVSNLLGKPKSKEVAAAVKMAHRMTNDEYKSIVDRLSKHNELSGRDDELSGTESGLKHKQAIIDLEKKYGAASGYDEKVAKKKSRTLAKLLGIDDEDLDGLDVDAMVAFLKRGGKKHWGLDKQTQQFNKIRALRRHIRRLNRDVKQLKLNKQTEKISNPKGRQQTKSNISVNDDVLSALGTCISEINLSKIGAGITGLFNKAGRAELGKKAINAALKHYLAALAVSSVFNSLDKISNNIGLMAPWAHDKSEQKKSSGQPLQKKSSEQPLQKKSSEQPLQKKSSEQPAKQLRAPSSLFGKPGSPLSRFGD